MVSPTCDSNHNWKLLFSSFWLSFFLFLCSLLYVWRLHTPHWRGPIQVHLVTHSWSCLFTTQAHPSVSVFSLFFLFINLFLSFPFHLERHPVCMLAGPFWEFGGFFEVVLTVPCSFLLLLPFGLCVVIAVCLSPRSLPLFWSTLATPLWCAWRGLLRLRDSSASSVRHSLLVEWKSCWIAERTFNFFFFFFFFLFLSQVAKCEFFNAGGSVKVPPLFFLF